MPVYKLVWRLGPVLAETLKVLSIIGILCSGQIFHVQQQIKQTWKQTKVWLSFKLNLRLGTTQHFGQFCDAPPPPHPHHHSLCSPCPCGSSDCSLWQIPFHRCCSGTVGSSTAQSGTRGFGGVAAGWTAGWRLDRTPVCGTCTDVHLQHNIKLWEKEERRRDKIGDNCVMMPIARVIYFPILVTVVIVKIEEKIQNPPKLDLLEQHQNSFGFLYVSRLPASCLSMLHSVSPSKLSLTPSFSCASGRVSLSINCHLLKSSSADAFFQVMHEKYELCSQIHL